MEIYSTNNLIEVVKKTNPVRPFLYDHYMPTGPRDIFKTKKVFIERTDSGNNAAPFVIPYSGAVLMERLGYTAEELNPAFVNPSMDMSIDQAMKKGLGETLYDEVTPEEREQNYLADDLVELQKSVMRSIEWMIGQIIVYGYVDCVIGDSNSNEKVRFKYYDSSFSNKMTILDSSSNTEYWDSQGADVYAHVSKLAGDIPGEYGALDLVLGVQAADAFLADSNIRDRLNILNANFGALNPGETIPDGVGYLGTMNFAGKNLNIYVYTERVTIGGSQVYYFHDRYAAVLPRSNFGATKFGSITQMEEEDRQLHTRTGIMVPRRLTDVKSHLRTLEMASAPLPHPYALDSWRVEEAIASS